MSRNKRQIMYTVLGAAAGVVSIGGSLYYSLKSWTAARAKGQEDGRHEVLGQLAKFGPNRVRAMCLEAGIRFIEPANDEFVAERRLEDGLTAEIRAALEAELRESMKVEVEGEVRAFLREEMERDAVVMRQLRDEARDSIYRDLRKSTAVKDEVRTEIKREIRAELRRSGRDVSLIAEAMTDLRAETREALRSEMRGEVQKQLRKELEPKVKESLKNEAAEGQVQTYADETGNSWTSYTQTVPASTKRR
ncbi:hypothetical protein V8E51_016590 [Hyaloscypha variabilis]|uniref:Uncharacterized protein n=1 Tax=Hyaloscypha variabilis (strain UAMH 11265 / GT02V1 / F) TaxID=1149755 RepID=A0A2J6RNU9_HYAVF|nr:hypothetical protein L207DRAFT_565719 [Hyaloscypha variabilis F]